MLLNHWLNSGLVALHPRGTAAADGDAVESTEHSRLLVQDAMESIDLVVKSSLCVMSMLRTMSDIVSRRSEHSEYNECRKYHEHDE
mmetsp:Transcript_37212/g.84297  ORF Transcript_37212/g.84297 Transcript_37212/m.84297 type:complete len:86 (-) Transcript_37212:44-301(-)